MNQYLPHIALALLVGFIGYSIYKDEMGNLDGTAAAAFTIENLAGTHETGPQDHRGKVVMLDFWATWCAPCQASMPMIDRVNQFYSQDDFTLISVNIDNGRDRPRRIQNFIRRFDLDFEVWLDDGQAARAYGVTNIPHVVIIDRDGVVRQVHTGSVSERRIRSEIDSLL